MINDFVKLQGVVPPPLIFLREGLPSPPETALGFMVDGFTGRKEF